MYETGAATLNLRELRADRQETGNHHGPGDGALPRVSAVVLARQAEPWLRRCVEAPTAFARLVDEAERTVPEREWMCRLTDQLDTTATELPTVIGPLNAGTRVYWRLVHPLG